MTILQWLAWLVVLGYVADLSYHDHATLRLLAVPVFWLWAAYGVYLVPMRFFKILRGAGEWASRERAARATAQK
jgi:hypothetical protein